MNSRPFAKLSNKATVWSILPKCVSSRGAGDGQATNWSVDPYWNTPLKLTYLYAKSIDLDQDRSSGTTHLRVGRRSLMISGLPDMSH